MQVLVTADQVRRALRALPAGTRVGFVPTMGCLHSGHMSLVSASVRDCHCTIVSIFVNPAQFAPNEDLATYPRPRDDDLALCKSHHVDFVFAPAPDHVYPENYGTYVQCDVGSSDRNPHAEGAARPTFFRGVATVLVKLLVIIRPDVAYFGRKDAQQCAVVRSLVHDLWLDDVDIKVCDIARESDGLAMSSRNLYLSEEERKHAHILYSTLCYVTALAQSGERNAHTLRNAMTCRIGEWQCHEKPSNVHFQLVYVSVCCFATMREIQGDIPVNVDCIACIAAIMGKTRLLDNMFLHFPT